MNDIGIKQEDFIDYILRLIRKGDKGEALKEILELRDDNILATIDKLVSQTNQADILHFYLRLAKTLYWLKDFSGTLGDIQILDYDLNQTLTSILALTTVLAYDLAVDIDLPINLALDIASAQGLTSTSALSRAHSLARALARTRALDSTHRFVPILKRGVSDLSYVANILALLISDVFPQAMIQVVYSTYYRNLADALDEMLFLQRQKSSDILDVVTQVIASLLEDNPLHITLEGVDRITPSILSNQINPYLEALNEYLSIYAELMHTPFKELRIVQMHNALPTLELLKVFVDPISNLVEFFVRRKDEKPTREVDLKEKELKHEVTKRKAEQEFTQIALEEPNLPEAAKAQLAEFQTKTVKLRVEAEQALLDLEKARYDFARQKRQDYMEDAAKFVAMYCGDLSPEERLEFTVRTAATFKQMDESGLIPRLGWHEVSRPTTVPGLPKPPDKS